jgi:hypothetical protein
MIAQTMCCLPGSRQRGPVGIATQFEYEVFLKPRAR